MNKSVFHIPEGSESEFDFGFTAATKEEINHTKTQEFNEIEQKYQKIISKLLKTIGPFLNNLAKDGEDKEYIYWPNRKEKIEKFEMKLRQIAEG